MNLEGGCSCGAVRYALTRAPMFTHCCHCLDCQKQTGGAFAINALVEAAHLPLAHGAPERITMPTDSGRPHDIYRCPACKVAVWSDYGRRETLLFLRTATLDTAHAITPDVHIFTHSKVPWVDVSGPLPNGSATGRPALVVDVYYDMAKEWPAESRARREAVTKT